jgi:uncharacterized membrane-anchored protein YitT (DUF2179 family)
VALLKIGSDGLILLWAVIVSLALALLSWRRVGTATAGVTTLGVVVALVVWEMFEVDPASPGHQLLRASFIVVPSALLFGASRVSWLARRWWALLLLGPIAFVGGFVGICVCAYRFFGA